MATEQVVEQVAEHLEEAAEVTRHINAYAVRYFLGGTGFGAVLGAFFGYRFNREKIKAEAFKESEEEIARMREHYHAKQAAAENDEAKEQLAEVVVRERYAHIEETEPQTGTAEQHLHVHFPGDVVDRVFRTTEAQKDKNDGWNFPRELATRAPDRPYIIHQDEFANNETEFSQVTYTYYAEDDVLVDEHEEVIAEREGLIGNGFLSRFGHGTDDFNILYVRNPVRELEIEICRSPGSYEVEVLGLEREPSNGPGT